MILILEYIVIATAVVWLSVLASRYIDMLDRKTTLSGAFLGGVMLSAVTSLPELFTSISATTLLDKPSLCIGNILGSDIFNSAMLAFTSLLCIRSFRRARISKGNILVALFVLAIYAVIVADWYFKPDISFFNISVVTLVVVVLYFIGVKYLASEETEKPDDADEVSLSVGTIAWRFSLTSVGIVVSSILMTYVTDSLALRFGIGEGFAGALFLGVATSLPEVSSTIALFRMKNFNIAVGNIVGSNIFNFFILCIADVICLKQVIYDYSDPKVESLVVWGAVSALFVLGFLKIRSVAFRIFAFLAVMAAYFMFLLG